MRILLVEDDPLIGHGVSQSLIEASHTCLWVKDGKAAMAALVDDGFDAVLLDLGLPGMGGTAVLRQLREPGKDIPIIIITARDGVQGRIRGLDLGAVTTWSSPFHWENCRLDCVPWHGAMWGQGVRSWQRRGYS